MATVQFDRIYHNLSPDVGKLRVATTGMAWKGTEADSTVVALAAGNIKWAQWLRVARSFQLRVGLKDYTKEKFDGFAREDFERLTRLMKDYFSITLETREISFKGWNWGVTDFQGEDLAFTVSDKTSFELPLRQVGNSNIAGRTEVSIDFNPAPRAGPQRQMGDELVEIRFYVPGTISKLRGSDAGSTKSDNEDDEEISAAQVFHDTIKEKAAIGQVTGDLILSFEEALVLTPRGRYDMDMFRDFLRLRGKTYDYKVQYQSIARLFLLPKDDQHVLFILGLSTPIRQGQTLYQYLVMQFAREEEITAELNMSDEDIAKYEKLKKHYEEPTYEVVSSVFRALSGKKIIGSGSFQSREGHPGFKANLKAVQGDLFMLERYIFFVSKSPLLIELSDIHTVIFSRVGSGGSAAGRTFDIKIVTKGGPEHSFTSINKEEHEVVEAYLKDKRVKVKNEMVPDADLLLAAVGDEDEDEDMASVVSSDDEEDDGRRRGKKAKAQSRPSNRAADDDDSEDDEDFEASGSDSGSPSESDSDSSGAETASDASGDLQFTNAAKKGKGKAKASAKKKAPAEDGSDEEGKPKPKPKPKAKPKNKEDSMDVDGEDKPKPKPKPKPKAAAEGGTDMPKPKPKPKAAAKNEDDAMDVDDAKPAAKPKPKPKPVAAAASSKKKEDGEDGPPKKKLKKDD